MSPDPHTMTVLEFATSILDQFTIDPDTLLKVEDGEPMPAWEFLSEKILDAVDELALLLEMNS